MADRLRHPDKQLNRLVIQAYEQGWRVTKGKKYYRLWCPCEEKHKRSLAITPSGAHYELNWRKHSVRTTCWKD